MLNTELKNIDRINGEATDLVTSNSQKNGRSINSAGWSSIAAINIRNLRLRTYIGFNAEERVKQQDVVINIEIHYGVNHGVLDDEVRAVLDYKTVTKKVIKHVEGGKFLLLEKLVSDVLEICSDHPAVKRALVTIDKPHALRFADSVSLTLEYRPADSETNSFSGVS